MPVESFEVESYRVALQQSGSSRNSSLAHRRLEVAGPVESDGSRPTARLYFLEADHGSGPIGRAYGLGSAAGPRYTVYLPQAWFEDVYQVLQTENPVRLHLLVDTPRAGGRSDIRYVQVGTADPEPPGEGPEDETP